MKLAIFLAAAALPATVAFAADPAVSLSSNVMVEKTVTTANGPQTTLVKPSVVVPGDRLLFTTAYRNAGAQPAQKFVVTNPLPSGVAYAGDASTGAEVSVDGGRHFGQLSALTVAAPGAAPRAARVADVTHLRWTIATIPAGGSGSLRYRGTVR